MFVVNISTLLTIKKKHFNTNKLIGFLLIFRKNTISTLKFSELSLKEKF